MRTPSLRNILPNGTVKDNSCVREALCTILDNARDMMLEQDSSYNEGALANRKDTCRPFLIMDINLPAASGIDRMPELSHCFLSVKFLLYSMPDDDHRECEALNTDVNGYLLKSNKQWDILGALGDLMRSGSPLSAPVARWEMTQMRPAKPGSTLAHAGLTDREQEVLQLLAEGLLYKEMSLRIGISEAAIKQHVHRMYGKLHVQNRTEAVNRFFGR